MQAVFDRYPDLRSEMLRGHNIDPTLQLLVAGGQMNPSDVQYIRTFNDKVQTLPR